MISLRVIKNDQLLSEQSLDRATALDTLNTIVCLGEQYQLTLSTVEVRGFLLLFDHLLAIPALGLLEQVGKEVEYHFVSSHQQGAPADQDYSCLLMALQAYMSLGVIRCHMSVLSELRFFWNTCSLR